VTTETNITDNPETGAEKNTPYATPSELRYRSTRKSHMQAINSTLKDHIYDLMKENDMPNTRACGIVGDRIGVTATAVQNWCQGKTVPVATHLIELVKYMCEAGLLLSATAAEEDTDPSEEQDPTYVEDLPTVEQLHQRYGSLLPAPPHSLPGISMSPDLLDAVIRELKADDFVSSLSITVLEKYRAAWYGKPGDPAPLQR